MKHTGLVHLKEVRKLIKGEKSPFPFNQGSGHSTEAEIFCDWCGTTYNKGVNDDNNIAGYSVRHIKFGKIQICDCCFDPFEKTMIAWFPEVVEFMAERLKLAKAAVEEMEASVDKARELVEALESKQ